MILNNAASFLRTALARSVKLRVIPQLSFLYDSSTEYGNRMAKLINEVTPEDEEGAEE